MNLRKNSSRSSSASGKSNIDPEEMSNKSILEELAEYIEALKDVSDGKLNPLDLDDEYEEEENKDLLPPNKYKFRVLDHFINMDQVSTLDEYATTFRVRQESTKAIMAATGTTIYKSFDINMRVLQRNDLFDDSEDESDDEEDEDGRDNNHFDLDEDSDDELDD